MNDEIRDGFDLIEYPCEYMFKAISRSGSTLEMEIRQILTDALSSDRLIRFSSMASRNGRFTSITCVARLVNRDELESVYSGLSDHPRIVMTL